MNKLLENFSVWYAVITVKEQCEELRQGNHFIAVSLTIDIQI